MSYPYYNELWLISRNDLAKLIELDRALQKQPRTENSDEGLNELLPLYLRYRNLVKRLIVCHDQMIQTQKRDLIKQVLDCAVGRMLEYKREIVNLNYSDYQWPDDFLNQLKYTPDDIEIVVSACGKDIVRERRETIHRLIEDARKVEETASVEPSIAEETDSATKETPKLRRRAARKESAGDKEQMIPVESPEEIAAREARLAAEREMQQAMLLIQSHERARMGRCAGADVQRMYAYNKKLESGEIAPKKLHRKVYVNAAETIQRAWKRYLARKRREKRMEREEELLGMTIPSWKSREIFEKAEENFQKKLTDMPGFAGTINERTEKERARLLKVRGPGLMQDITEEIREWFVIWYNELGHFDVYPAADLGGSVLIATGQTLTPREYLIQKRSKAVKGGRQVAKSKPKKISIPWITETEAFTLLDTANRDFIDNWSFRDDTGDYRARIYGDLITDRLCHRLQLEMREIVDDLMRLELQRLNRALKKDYAADNKTIDIPKEKRKKTGKGGKKKDQSGDTTVAENFKELALADIIREYPVTRLNDWLGDRSYENYEAARELRDHRHRMGEVKEAVMDYCILPLSSKEIHRVAPLVRSACICGLPRHGKTFLVNAICSEVGAVLFDVSPPCLLDKYTGRKNERRLIEMIGRVAREYAPSVILVDNGEKPWLKTVPAAERYLKPKRFARHFPKLVKSIKRGDQILFLTTSSEPYKATRPFVRVHDKFITIPLTDYNTLYMFYKDLLMRYHGVGRDLDVSCIARTTVGIPLEFIRNAVDTVLCVRRRIALRFRPLEEREIIEEVLKYETSSQPAGKIFTQMEKFQSRTPLARKRARYWNAKKSDADM